MNVGVFFTWTVLAAHGIPLSRHNGTTEKPLRKLSADGENGVELTRAGSYTMELTGKDINFKVCHSSSCQGALIFWYDTSEPKTYNFHRSLSKDGQCPFAADFGTPPLIVMAEGFTYNAFTTCAAGSVGTHGITFSGSNTYNACPVQLKNGQITIDVESLPTGCTVTITNANSLEEEEDEAKGVNPLYYVIPIVVILLIAFVVLAVVLAVCLCRKKKTPAPAAPTPVALKPSFTSPDTRPSQSEAALGGEQTSQAPQPSSKMEEESSAKPKESQAASSPAADLPTKPKITKENVLPVPEKSNAAPTPAATANKKTGEKPVVPPSSVKDAPTTVEDDFDGFDKPVGKKPEGPTNWVNNADFTSAKRMNEAFDKQRERGSVISAKSRSTRSKGKSKQDSLELMRTPFETAAESMVRHGMLDKLKDDAMNVSIVNDNNEPLKFKQMKKYYNEDVRHDVDPRELRLLVSPVREIYKLVNEFGDEAKAALQRNQVVFVTDEPPQFSSEARAFLDKKSTPQFIRAFAFSAEFGHLISTTTDDETLERRFANYSIQLLLILAFRKELGEVVRRKAIASMVRKLPKIVGIYSDDQISKMPYPIYLLPDGLKANPNFLKEIHLIRTEPGSTEDRQKEIKPEPKRKGRTKSKSKSKASQSKSRSKSKRTTEACGYP